MIHRTPSPLNLHVLVASDPRAASLVTAPQTVPSYHPQSQPLLPHHHHNPSSPGELNIPLCPFLVKDSMPTFLAPYWVALLQLDLDRAVTALVSCYGFRYRCGRAVVGGLACEGWWGVGFAGHGGKSTGGRGSLRGVGFDTSARLVVVQKSEKLETGAGMFPLMPSS